jgi:hypothetical protein
MVYILDEATPVHEDNTACMELAMDPNLGSISTAREQSTSIPDFTLSEIIFQREKYPEVKLADGLTKALGIERFNKLNELSGISTAPREVGMSRLVPSRAVSDRSDIVE